MNQINNTQSNKEELEIISSIAEKIDKKIHNIEYDYNIDYSTPFGFKVLNE